MPQSRLSYLLVGGFVLAVLAALIAVLAALSGRSGETSYYYTSYPNVAGLKYGTPVFYEGFLAGQVDGIRPRTEAGETRFRITLEILSDLQIPDDSVALIIQPNLLSGRAISIAAGGSRTSFEPGAEIPGGGASGLAALPELVGGGQDLVKQGRALMEQVTAAMKLVNDWLQADFERVAGKYEALPGSLQGDMAELSGQANDLIVDMGAVVGRVDRLLNDRTIADVGRTVDNVEKTTARMERASRDLEALSNNIETITVQLRNFMADNRPDMEGSIVDLRFTLENLAQRIDAVTYNMEGPSRNMYEFSRQIRLNPGLLLGGTAPEDEAATGE